MNLFLNPSGWFALFFSKDLEDAPPAIRDQGQQMIHIKEGEEDDKDQEKGKEEDKKKIHREKVLKPERGKEKDHQDDEKIIDPRSNQGSQPLCHADSTHPV